MSEPISITVKYKLSDEARWNITEETGLWEEMNHEAYFDLQDLPKSKRELVLAHIRNARAEYPGFYAGCNYVFEITKKLGDHPENNAQLVDLIENEELSRKIQVTELAASIARLRHAEARVEEEKANIYMATSDQERPAGLTEHVFTQQATELVEEAEKAMQFPGKTKWNEVAVLIGDWADILIEKTEDPT